MYFKLWSVIQFALLLSFVVNVAIWFFTTDSFCQSAFGGDVVSSSRAKKGREFQNSLARLHQTIVRMKRSEVAVDRLLSRFARKKLGKNLPTIYCITPTYTRPTQKADLTRLCQSLQHVWNFHWIVVEDSEHKTDLVSRFLERCGVTYTHLAVRTSAHLRQKKKHVRWKPPRGMEQRNKGLQWIRRNFDPHNMKGVVYFGDDDNAYDVEIFRWMRKTKNVSVWPVGLAGGLRWEGPICKNNTIVGFRVVYKPNRDLPVDMAGFAVNAKLVVNHPRLLFYPNSVAIGHSESQFLSMITTRAKVESLGELCNKVLVWHTRTADAKLHFEGELKGKSFPDLEC